MTADIIPHPRVGNRLIGCRVLDLASGVEGTMVGLAGGSERIVARCVDGVTRMPRLERVLIDESTVAGAPISQSPQPPQPPAPPPPPPPGDAA